MKYEKIRRPPGLPTWLLRRLKRYQREYLIAGDLEEAFHELAEERGHVLACLWFWHQTICCLLMGSYVLHELSYENMHPLKERIFRINGSIPFGDNVLLNAVVGAPLAPAAKESLPEIEDYVCIKREHDLPVRVGDKIIMLARAHLPEDEKDAAYYLQPLDRIYIDNARDGMNNDLDTSGSITRIYIFSLIAVLILGIAVINFI